MASGGPLGEGRGLNITLLAEGGEELYILCHKYPADSKGCKFVSVFWMKSEEVCNLTAYMPAKDVTSLQVALKMCLCVSIDKPNFGPCEVSVLFSMRYELTFRACGRIIYIYIYFKDGTVALPVTEKARLRSSNQPMWDSETNKLSSQLTLFLKRILMLLSL